MKRTKISLYFIFIAIFTFFTLFILIVQKSYENLVKSSNQIKESNINPIDPKLDLSVISEIEKRADIPFDTKLEIIDDTVPNPVFEASSSATNTL